MKIYHLAVSSYMTRNYFFATKAEAEKARLAELAEETDCPIDSAEITVWECAPTRKDIALTLNHLVSYLCANEG